MSKSLFAFALGSVILFSGCSKSSPSAPTFTEGFNVYMTGNADGKAVYWKNGVQTDLATQGTGQAIAVSGSDVYVGGYIYDGANTEAAYWKNGQQTVLEGPGVSHVFGIAVNGTDVYCVGDKLSPLGTGRDSAVYWKNGVRFYLSPNAKAKATCILLAGSEIYIGGQVWDSFDTAVVWKNGSQEWYSIPGVVSAVVLSPTDTIVAGSFGNGGAYLTQGQLHQLKPNGYGTSAAVSGSDIYISGDTVSNSGKSQAVYWKNELLTGLKSGYDYSSSLGIALAGADIYSVGDVFDDNLHKYLPVYWKNGTMIKIGNDGEVYAVCVGQ